MEKLYRECAPKASPKRFLFYFGKQNSHSMQEILLKIRYFER